MRASFELLTITVAGVEHHEWGVKRMASRRKPEELPYGTTLSMVREPQNPYSKNAIRLHTAAGNMVGFVPEVVAAWMHRLIDHGYELSAKVEAVDLRDHKIVVTVMMVSPQEKT